ncbi:hypothetical protein PY365_08745 [Roseiarcaceae bacterium H3SJ34-1]|uniref:hypothetical protein n=1 Tax=Terripilifer ovatus TaxID=3032367 RepID=UPI003AB9971C|nr:hypothetical protein [Roseiarcaceae bacterium H3SJ34-1]
MRISEDTSTRGFGRLVSSVLAAGVTGLVAWEVFARLVAPLLIGEPLDATALVEMALGIAGWKAILIHIATGLVLYPLGYLLIESILARHVPLNWVVLGIAYGFCLWVFAMYVIASIAAGMPPFLGFQPVAWASLAGHILMTLGIAGAIRLSAKFN